MQRKRSLESGRSPTAGLILLLALTLSGCGRSATVSGTVRYKDAPLPSGTVTFHGPNSQTAIALINSDGSYTATKVPLGPVKVAVTTPPPVSAAKVKLAQQVKKGQLISPGAKPVSIPKQYGDPERSGLELTVTTGSQPFNIDLK
jgi:hypothetical protein